MRREKINLGFAIAVLLGLVFCHSVVADWPSFRGNPQRTSFRNQKIRSTKWSPAWVREFTPPKAAWSNPARGSIWQNLTSIEARVTDDRANVPLIAKDVDGRSHVIIPSSTEDRLVSLDIETGEIRWQVETNGPIRFAPAIHAGTAFFGADDGCVRAINLKSGKVIWSRAVGPGYAAIVGNGRLISPHPIRTSIIYQNDLIIAHAGLFPSQGVYSVALDPDDGSVVWRRRIPTSSQGYLLATGDNRVYVPTGRASPYAIESSNGKKLYDLPSPGGTFCMLTPKVFFSGPGNSPAVQSFATKNNAKMLSYKARQIAVGKGKIWTANGARLACHDLDELLKGKQKTVWQVDSKAENGLAVTGDNEKLFVFAGGKGSIEVFDALTGDKIQKIGFADKHGEVIHLAIHGDQKHGNDSIIATTDQGSVLCWNSQSRANKFPAEKTAEKKAQEQKRLSTKIDLKEAISKLRSKFGFALVVGSNIENEVQQLLDETSLHIVGLVNSGREQLRLRSLLREQKRYGVRATVFSLEDSKRTAPFAHDLFNLVVNVDSFDSVVPNLKAMTCPGTGLLVGPGGEIYYRQKMKNAGAWRHQYANTRNLADSGDKRVGNAAAFKLKWFGGVGPSRMPDRHLRGPAPLAVGSAMIVHGDGVLIGVDPANGTERWQFQLPKDAMRYVTPYDGGYVCLTENGDEVTLAANQKILTLDTFSGEVLATRNLDSKDYRWGYLSRDDHRILTTKMKLSAPRIARDRKTQRTYVDSDYRSERPLVCSRTVTVVDTSFVPKWERESVGIIPNGTISVDYENSECVFVEGRSKKCLGHETDRVVVADILEDAYLVCLNINTGKTKWETKLQWPDAKNILYTQITDHGILLTTSQSAAGKAKYFFRFYSREKGLFDWEVEHNHIKGGLYHGEQVHHPLILKSPDGKTVLVAEPYFYDLETGRRIIPFGDNPNWAIQRPGHSCGTLSGSGNCLFFRANNPTVLNLNQSQENKFTALAPSRPGCWINIIPATGNLLIPEASASCVCKYSLQTSMCFEPVSKDMEQKEIRILPDVLPSDK